MMVFTGREPVLHASEMSGESAKIQPNGSKKEVRWGVKSFFFVSMQIFETLAFIIAYFRFIIRST